MNKVIIHVTFDEPPKPPANVVALPKSTKFIATRRIVSSYRMDVVEGKVQAVNQLAA